MAFSWGEVLDADWVSGLHVNYLPYGRWHAPFSVLIGVVDHLIEKNTGVYLR